MRKFVISTRRNGEFQFSLVAVNGENILISEGYTTKASCLNGIDSVKRNATLDASYERKTSINGKAYFNLKATNGQVIGTSEMYESMDGMEKGIDSVKRNAPGAPVHDETDI